MNTLVYKVTTNGLQYEQYLLISNISKPKS